MFIDGKWTNAHNQETFASFNPANTELLGEVPLVVKKMLLPPLIPPPKPSLLGPR